MHTTHETTSTTKTTEQTADYRQDMGKILQYYESKIVLFYFILQLINKCVNKLECI